MHAPPVEPAPAETGEKRGVRVHDPRRVSCEKLGAEQPHVTCESHQFDPVRLHNADQLPVERGRIREAGGIDEAGGHPGVASPVEGASCAEVTDPGL